MVVVGLIMGRLDGSGAGDARATLVTTRLLLVLVLSLRLRDHGPERGITIAICPAASAWGSIGQDICDGSGEHGAVGIDEATYGGTDPPNRPLAIPGDGCPPPA